ncbi:MAG: PQQ-dependent sugar dehydrogenase [Actinomycetota bacterium]
MRRAIAWAAAATVLVAVPPVGDRPASAGTIVRVVVASCPSGPAQCWPTAFAFTPNGRKIFYVERFSGEVRVYNLDTGKDHKWATVGGLETGLGETGLLGIALDPRWKKPKLRWVYLYFTKEDPFVNRIVRKRKAGGGIKTHKLVDIPAGGIHNGGTIGFGPGGKLFAVTGETGKPALAQKKKNKAGKVLRMRKNGKRPSSNPIAMSLAYSYGHRNSFGFAFDPETGFLWQTENGPECEDEINRIRAGKNYGWGGASSCPDTNDSGPNPIGPEHVYTPTIAPTGAAFCFGCKLGGAAEDDLFFGAWNDGKIRRLVLSDDRKRVLSEQVVFDNSSGILGVVAAPDGRIYFSDRSGIYRLAQS